jgi:hypothetical protein
MPPTAIAMYIGLAVLASGKLSAKRIELLNSLGFEWSQV